MIPSLMNSIYKALIYTIPELLFMPSTIQNPASCNADILKHEHQLSAGNLYIFLFPMFFPPASFYLYGTIVSINSA